LDLPGMLVFDYPTLNVLCEFVRDSLSVDSAVDEKCEVVLGDLGLTGSEIVAEIQEFSCSHDFDEVDYSMDTVRPVPFNRWGNDVPFYLNESFISGRFFGFLDDIEQFDTVVYNLNDVESRTMDSQQRILLNAMFKASQSWNYLHRSQCSVYVGLAPNEHSSTTAAFCEQGVYTATSEAISVGSGRISYMFGLKGPSMTVDTACSASLVASHLSIRGIKACESMCSIIAGALIIVKQSCQRLQKAGMLSVSGRCKTLDVSADGYVRGEGCALYCIGGKSEEDRGLVLQGSAVNQDGRSSSLTAPNGPSQQAVIRIALQDASSGISDIGLMQLHGTGTSLGDPIEIGALMSVLSPGAPKAISDPVSLFSVKSSIGHSEVGAGVMAIAHSVAAHLRRKDLPLSHLRNLNPYIEEIFSSVDGKDTKCPRQSGSLVSSKQTQSEKKICGISSFAFQGTNAHVVLLPSTDDIVNGHYSMMSWQAERCAVTPGWKRMTGRFVEQQRSTDVYIQCILGGCHLSDMLVTSSDVTLLSSWASVEMALETSNIFLTKGLPYALNQALLPNSLTVENDQVKSSSVNVVDALLSPKNGRIKVVSGNMPILDCAVVKLEHMCSRGSLSSISTHAPLQGVPVWGEIRDECIASLQQEKNTMDGFICHPKVLDSAFTPLRHAYHRKAQEKLSSLELLCVQSCGSRNSMMKCHLSSGTSLSLRSYYEYYSMDIVNAQFSQSTGYVPMCCTRSASTDHSGDDIEPYGRTNDGDSHTDNMQSILNIVREVLQCEDVDPDETFFDAGIDSLSSLHLRALLQEKMKVQLPGTLINDYPTARSLCEMVSNSRMYEAIYLPPLHDPESESLRQIPACLPKWYQLVMLPSKKIYELTQGMHWPAKPGVYRVQPFHTTSGPVRHAACSTVDINVAWTRMRSTFFFEEGIDDKKLISSLSRVLDAFPSFTSTLVERNGNLFFEYGGPNAHLDVRVSFASAWIPQDYIGMVIPGIWNLSIAVWIWQFIYSNIGIILLLAWRAYTSLFGSPLMRIRITHIIDEGEEESSFWLPWRKNSHRRELEKSKQRINGTYLTVDWMHSLADGGTMGRFMSLWAMAFRDEPLLVSHAGPLNSLTVRQKELFTRMWLNESPVPRLYRPLAGMGLNYMRFLLSNELINRVQMRCKSAVRASDIAVAHIWAQASKLTQPLDVPLDASNSARVTFLEDLRQHMPELQPFAGNMIRFLPFLSPPIEVSVDESTESEVDIAIAAVADLIYAHRKRTHFTTEEIEESGKLSGIPCCWSALHEAVEGNAPIVIVNDLVPFDSPLRFDDNHIGIVPAESTGWRPDIPHFDPDMLVPFAKFPLWQVWLTRGPDGLVVSIFSMP